MKTPSIWGAVAFALSIVLMALALRQTPRRLSDLLLPTALILVTLRHVALLSTSTQTLIAGAALILTVAAIAAALRTKPLKWGWLFFLLAVIVGTLGTVVRVQPPVDRLFATASIILAVLAIRYLRRDAIPRRPGT